MNCIGGGEISTFGTNVENGHSVNCFVMNVSPFLQQELDHALKNPETVSKVVAALMVFTDPNDGQMRRG